MLQIIERNVEFMDRVRRRRNYLVKVLVCVMTDADTSLVFLREADVLTSAPCTVLWRHLRTGSEALYRCVLYAKEVLYRCVLYYEEVLYRCVLYYEEVLYRCVLIIR